MIGREWNAVNQRGQKLLKQQPRTKYSVGCVISNTRSSQSLNSETNAKQCMGFGRATMLHFIPARKLSQRMGLNHSMALGFFFLAKGRDITTDRKSTWRGKIKLRILILSAHYFVDFCTPYFWALHLKLMSDTTRMRMNSFYLSYNSDTRLSSNMKSRANCLSSLFLVCFGTQRIFRLTNDIQPLSDHKAISHLEWNNFLSGTFVWELLRSRSHISVRIKSGSTTLTWTVGFGVFLLALVADGFYLNV